MHAKDVGPISDALQIAIRYGGWSGKNVPFQFPRSEFVPHEMGLLSPTSFALVSSRIELLNLSYSTGSVALSQLQCFFLPGAASESDHLESPIVRPQNAEHLRPAPHIEPVWQIRPRVLPFERVAIARRGGLPKRQLAERRPMMQFSRDPSRERSAAPVRVDSRACRAHGQAAEGDLGS